MNPCRETTKMGGPPGNHRVLAPRRNWAVRRRGSLSWACRRNTRGRLEGRPYPWSQQV